MLFAISPGSEGNGLERFSASMPFILAPGSKLQVSEPIMHPIECGQYLKLEKLQLRYSVSLGPYSSEVDAEHGLRRLTAALLWSALEFNLGLQYPSERGMVHLYEQSVPIPDTNPMAHIGKITGWKETDGHYDADLPVVRPEHKRLLRFEGGQANFTVGIASDNFLIKIKEALQLPNAAEVACNDKLRLAIEICTGHKFEISHNAQFVALVTALEALLPEEYISASTSEALGAARAAALDSRKKYLANSPEWTEINHLLSRLGLLQQEAIGTSMRRFALAVVKRHPELGDTEVTSTALRDAYTVRSRLLHDGQAEPALLSEKLTFLRQFVPKLLRTLFLEAASKLDNPGDPPRL